MCRPRARWVDDVVKVSGRVWTRLAQNRRNPLEPSNHDTSYTAFVLQWEDDGYVDSV